MTILFDLDGTLLDTALDFFYTINQLRAEEQKPLLKETDLYRVRLAISGGLAELLSVTLDLPSDHFEELGAYQHHFGKRFIEIYQKNLSLHTRPFPGIDTLLTTLEKRNILWGIVTNKPGRQTEALLAQLGLLERAACVVSGDTTPNPKPHPAPLFHACQQIKIPPNQCIYVGDAERDIIAGKAAGMATIGALFGYIENTDIAKKWGADHYVLHPDEILPWFEQWQLQKSK